MRRELLAELSTAGYEILPEGENIKLRYRKQGAPPDTVKPLIDELKKCKAEILTLLKAPQSVDVWTNPHRQGTPEARRESLRMVMEANLHQAMSDIQAGRRWKVTPEVRELEEMIDRANLEILAGRGDIEDFILLVAQWKNAGTGTTGQRRDDA
ncbi:MAG: hypothetical protein A4E66_00848 [Syntrophus sp. PtaB.Bin001]|nr:MAG: hypothetical protein A4E66_00848 [Syntrophus sp. PtaB.Bin001]